MPSARNIITRALRQLGVIATGEVPSADEAQDGLDHLNDLLDSWSLESTLVYGETITVKTLTALKKTYTVGSGGEINITWPLQIDQAQLRVTSSSQNLDLPLRVLTAQEYGLIRLKDEQSTYPQAVWLQTSQPLGTLYLWPVPTEANDLVLWTKGVIASFTDLDTNVNLARGYARALRYNLAVELAPEHGRSITPELAVLAIDSKATIKRSNTKPSLLSIDVPAGQQGFGAYNWLTDEGA